MDTAELALLEVVATGTARRGGNGALESALGDTEGEPLEAAIWVTLDEGTGDSDVIGISCEVVE